MGVMDGDPPKHGGARAGAGRKPTAPSRTIDYKPMHSTDAASVLSQEDKDSIRARAREKVRDEIKDRATKALLDQYLEEERQLNVPGEELCEIFLDLAPHSQYIMLDGKQYLHHHWYQVKRTVFQVLAEQENRGWAHDEQTQVTDAKGRRRYRPPLGIGFDNFAGRVGPWGNNRNLVVGSAELAGAGAAGVMGYQGAVEGLSSG